MDFIGVKAALVLGDELIVIQRDDKPGLRFAGLWDLPGGGREGEESPFGCIAREVHEELGITLKARAVVWQRTYPAMENPKFVAYFMVVMIARSDVDGIVFGNEGQGWKWIRLTEYLTSSEVVEPLKQRIEDYSQSKS